MNRVLLVRYGEIHLKGRNRPYFINQLYEKIRQILPSGYAIKAQGRFFVKHYDQQDEQTILDKMARIFGILSISKALESEKQWEDIQAAALHIMREEQEKRGGYTFKVTARRSDKSFPMRSMDMAAELGGYLLHSLPGVAVDVHAPEVTLGLEIREKAYLYVGEVVGVGGMPVGSGGKAALLLSGGIDSPVAGYMVSKRGVMLELVHFYSFPYTGERAKQKVIELARILAGYSGEMRLHLVYFTNIQAEIYQKCPDGQLTIIMRRFMMQLAERIARDTQCSALVTGEAIAQVASQTMDSLVCTDDAVTMPVFRPLIGFDKVEIMDRARAIGTYETSILPYEDCCTVFVPKNPVTHPRVRDIRRSEALLDAEALIQDALSKTETVWIKG